MAPSYRGRSGDVIRKARLPRVSALCQPPFDSCNPCNRSALLADWGRPLLARRGARCEGRQATVLTATGDDVGEAFLLVPSQTQARPTMTQINETASHV
jgi:hypothetical protein